MTTVAPPAQKDSCGVLIAELSARKSPLIDLALCLYGACAGPQSFPVLSRLAKKYHHDGLYRDALVSGMSDQEKAFAEYLRGTTPGCDTLIGLLNAVAKARSDGQKAPWAQERKAGRDGLTAGLLLFNTHCAICHGPTGQGTPNLAPPLDGSEFVGGHPDRLALIVLHGLEGPVTVKGTRYQFNAAMPGLAANPACSDADLAAILNFVRNAFSRAPSQVKPEQITAMRDKKPASGGAYTAPELLTLFNETQ
jgi:mono/diheme cytochrome c family protein